MIVHVGDYLFIQRIYMLKKDLILNHVIMHMQDAAPTEYNVKLAKLSQSKLLQLTKS